jgi:alpha-2-macroglobulin-like protein
MKAKLTAVIGLIATATLLAWFAQGELYVPGGEVSLVEMSDRGLTLEFHQTGARGTLEAELCQLDGKVLAKASREQTGAPVRLSLSADVKPERSADYYLRYRFATAQEFQQKSLFFLAPQLETIVLAQREYLAGTRPVVQVLVRDRAAGRPMPEAKVHATLMEGGKEVASVRAVTDARGQAPLAIELPDRPIEGAQLKIEVAAAAAKDTVEETLSVRPGVQTLLTTDKPMYQPGQTIHMRALSLRRPDRKEVAGEEATFEVEDAKGNKVFKRAMKTDAYGISHADFVLADELNQGVYRIRHLVGAAREEKTVTVEKYVLPKFKVNFTSDRAFYQPGDAVKGEIQTDYFFGKPVAGAQVRVACAKFDVAYTDFQTVEGKTDAAGHYAFEVKLPGHFVGQPLEAGNASVKLEIAVIDTADHREQLVRNLPVTAHPILIAAVPEAGELVPELENKVYLVTTYADGTPAAARVTWQNPPGGSPVAVDTDAGGFGEVAFTPSGSGPVNMKLAARDAKGAEGLGEISLNARSFTNDERILLRTDRALHKVGEDLNLAVSCSRRSGTVYVDVIKDRQTWLTRALDLKDGRALDRLALDAGLAGTVQVNAYVIGANGVIVRDQRLIVVDPANDLSIRVAPEAETYAPGEEAKITLRVLDARGRGAAAALGVMVVDEAVFALQEMQPGLEKIYFYLEKEIATPRYEIHGIELDDVVPMPLEDKAGGPRQQEAARVLLASAKGVGDYPVQVNTYDRDNKSGAFAAKMRELLAPRHEQVAKALAKFAEARKKELREKPDRDVTLDELVTGGFLRRNETLDPWGHTMKISGKACASCGTYHDFNLMSPGIDGVWETADDIAVSGVSRHAGWGGVRRFKALPGAAEDGVLMQAMPAAAVMENAPMPAVVTSTAAEKKDAEPAAPRIRSYFPETLYFNPAVITDDKGVASLAIPMADSITTWRMTCMASSAGRLGSTTAGIRVFQDFFVDVDFPVALTQHDEVSVPVAVYNYLDTEQTVRLAAEKGAWFSFKGEAEQSVTLKPGEVRAVYFPIRVEGVGFQTFTVSGHGSRKSDAVARTVELLPDGDEKVVSHSGRLEGRIGHDLEIPEAAIAGASKIFVKVYPGVLSQIVEGLQNLLRMPSGCFEQTSSVTYPNVLVLDYLKTTRQATPELQMKAEGFINSGYQRLLSFEVAGGGFEWFGKAPAHRILTAYGLMEFHDMAKVHDVDPAVIGRTQRWLASGQEGDGSWKPSAGGIAEGAINRFQNDVFRTTAYIVWALAHTGYKGAELERGAGYLRGRNSDVKDNYTLALAANALVTLDPKGAATAQLIERLLAARTEDKDVVYWKNEGETATCGRDESADIEVTGLAVQALVAAGREPGTVSKAVTWLVKKKDAYGTWQSTQATIQALRAMLLAERGATKIANARIALAVDGKDVKTLTVDATNSDVLQLVDLKEYSTPGRHRVELGFEGEGSLMYQVVGRCFLPRGPRAAEEDEPLAISVAYDRTHLATEDIVGAKATVTWRQPGAAQMIIVDLGLPPGFTLLPDKLNKLVESKVIQKYSVTGRQIIVYLDKLVSGKPVEIAYDLMAKHPLRAQAPVASAYEYYNPQSRAQTDPVLLEVTAK